LTTHDEQHREGHRSHDDEGELSRASLEPFRAAACANRFVVADAPCLRPLVDALSEAPRVVVLFIAGERARFIPVTEQAVSEEVVLDNADMVGHHRRGGWALLLQSPPTAHPGASRPALRRGGGALAGMAERQPRDLALFREHLPPPVAARIAGTIAGTQYEAAGVLARRAFELIRHITASGKPSPSIPCWPTRVEVAHLRRPPARCGHDLPLVRAVDQRHFARRGHGAAGHRGAWKRRHLKCPRGTRAGGRRRRPTPVSRPPHPCAQTRSRGGPRTGSSSSRRLPRCLRVAGVARR
jgi:hypothetical protein